MKINENTPNGKYNNILFDIENNIYFDEYFTNDILKPTDILVCYDERYMVVGCKLTQEEIFEVEMKKVGFNYKITFSDDNNVHYSSYHPTKELAFQAMLEDALKVIQDEIIEEYGCNDMMKSYRIETTDNSIKVKFGDNIYYLYELL